jgi:hypothetical protein
MRRWAGPALALLGAAVACAEPPAFLRPAPARAWPNTLKYAQHSADQGQYAAADSALTAFARRFPASQEAGESEYWRALFALDPRNGQHSAADAIAAIDAYFAAPSPRTHDAEAAVLARTATLLVVLRHTTEQAASTADSARTLADSALNLADSARVAHALRDRYTNAEVLRLRDSLEKVLVELAQTNQELDRIKRRLVEPKP